MKRKNILYGIMILTILPFVTDICQAQSNYWYANYGIYVPRDMSNPSSEDAQLAIINDRGPSMKGYKSIVFAGWEPEDRFITAHNAGYYPIIANIPSKEVYDDYNAAVSTIQSAIQKGADWIMVDDGFCSYYSNNKMQTPISKSAIDAIASIVHNSLRRWTTIGDNGGIHPKLASAEWNNLQLFNDYAGYPNVCPGGNYHWWDNVDIIMPYDYCRDLVGLHIIENGGQVVRTAFPTYAEALAANDTNWYYVRSMKNYLAFFRTKLPGKTLIPFLAYGNINLGEPNCTDNTWYDQFTGELILGIQPELDSSRIAGGGIIPKSMIMVYTNYRLNDQEEDITTKLQCNYGLGWGGISIWPDGATTVESKTQVSCSSYFVNRSAVAPVTYHWTKNGVGIGYNSSTLSFVVTSDCVIQCTVTDVNGRIIKSNTITYTLSDLEAKFSKESGKGIKELQDGVIPESFNFYSAYPNPFNPSTRLQYALPIASTVKLSIYDVMGREVARLVDGYQIPGYHATSWNAHNAVAGVYYARFTATDESGRTALAKVQKLVLIK